MRTPVGLLDGHDDRIEEAAALERSRTWRRLVFDSGYGWLGGPVELGGAGRSATLDEEYRILKRAFDVPDQQPFATGTRLVAPAVLAHGSAELQRRYLPGIFRGDLLVCQLLSEPEAGPTSPRRAPVPCATATSGWCGPEGVVVAGPPVAGRSAARPHRSRRPKHQGLTMFLIDMDLPGITVRPLRQMTGEEHFNEVFFDEVRVPDANRIGELGAGWRAVIATLMAERASVGSGANNSAVDPIGRLVDLARHQGRLTDPIIRQRLAALHTGRPAPPLPHAPPRSEGGGRQAARSRRLDPQAALRREARRCAELAGELLGASVLADTGEWGTFAWTRWITGTPMMRIAGGTDEIQRNTLAERVLGLPKEPSQ